MNKRYFNEKIYEDLKTKYGTTLTKKDLSEVLQISVSSINHYISKGGLGALPDYLKTGGGGKNSGVRFCCVNVADYLSNSRKIS